MSLLPVFPSFTSLADLPPLPLALDLTTLAWAGLALTLAYTLFALLGFGTALIASPPLASVLPVAQVIPLLALLDFAGAASRAWRARRNIATAELRRLLPGMLAGQTLGIMLLVQLPAPLMAGLLGSFVVVQGWRGLLAAQPEATAPGAAPAQRAIWPALCGGLLGGLFGSGGFMYASYLERQLADRQAFRATQAVLIALSTAWRIALCVVAGSLDRALLLTALLLSPSLLLGHWLAARIDAGLNRQRLRQLLNLLLLLAGSLLIWRHLPF